MADAVGRFHWLVIDTVDPARIAPFWCALLGVTERGWFGDDYLMLERDDHTPAIAFQRVPETKAVKNRLHVDVDVADVDVAVERGALSPTEARRLLDPARLTRPGRA